MCGVIRAVPSRVSRSPPAQEWRCRFEPVYPVRRSDTKFASQTSSAQSLYLSAGSSPVAASSHKVIEQGCLGRPPLASKVERKVAADARKHVRCWHGCKPPVVLARRQASVSQHLSARRGGQKLAGGTRIYVPLRIVVAAREERRRILVMNEQRDVFVPRRTITAHHRRSWTYLHLCGQHPRITRPNISEIESRRLYLHRSMPFWLGIPTRPVPR